MKINDVSEVTGISCSAIRFYERQGLIREVRKDKRGIRDFSKDDLKWIKFLVSIKNAGLSLREMMSYAELYYSKNENITDRLAVTMQCREKLMLEMDQLKEGIKFLDCKIEYYKKLIIDNTL